MSGDFTIRDLRLPEDKPACLFFIHGLQIHEHAFEPDRRVDAQVAEDYFAALMKRVAGQEGHTFIAEADAQPVGWAIFLIDHNYVYVVEEQRTFGYIAELFVREDARGRGIGRALIEACEGEGRRRGLKLMMIGVLPANARAAATYAKAGYAPYALELRKYL